MVFFFMIILNIFFKAINLVSIRKGQIPYHFISSKEISTNISLPSFYNELKCVCISFDSGGKFEFKACVRHSKNASVLELCILGPGKHT